MAQTVTFVGKKVEPYIAPNLAVSDAFRIKASQNIPRGTVLGEVTASPGTLAPYASGNSDGSQVAVGIAMYDMQTDASGNITFSDTASQAGGEFGQTTLSAPVWIGGYFKEDDLVGLDATAISALGRIVRGVSPHRILRMD